jgi:hypothetical protein
MRFSNSSDLPAMSGKFAESEPLAREAWDFGRKKQQDEWQHAQADEPRRGSTSA